MPHTIFFARKSLTVRPHSNNVLKALLELTDKLFIVQRLHLFIQELRLFQFEVLGVLLEGFLDHHALLVQFFLIR